jgi:hypothetical protein
MIRLKFSAALLILPEGSDGPTGLGILLALNPGLRFASARALTLRAFSPEKLLFQ